MTTNERTQLEKDILYEHHKADADFRAELVKLRREQGKLQLAADKLKIFADYLEHSPLRKEGAPSGEMPEFDRAEITTLCHDALSRREKVDQLAADKKSLGL